MANDRDRGRRDNQNRQPQQMRISLETEEPQKDGNRYKFLATAVVNRGDRAQPGLSVQFFSGAIESGAAVQTDQNGRASIIMQAPVGATAHTIEAQVVGTSARARKIVALPEKNKKEKPAPPKATRMILLGSSLADEAFRCVISRADEKGAGVPGDLLIFDNSFRTERSGDNGITVVAFGLGEKKRTGVITLPEKHDQSLEIEIPAKNRPGLKVAAGENTECGMPTAKSQKTFSVRLKEAYQKGRNTEKEK